MGTTNLWELLNKRKKKPTKPKKVRKKQKPIQKKKRVAPKKKTGGYSPAFKTAVEKVLLHEGGYVNHPNDPGGETNFGITKKTYPNLNIKALTRNDAIKIYYDDWWIKYGYNKFPHPKFAAKVFDTSINMGAKQAHKLVQRALRSVGNADIVDDGILGNMSMAAITKSNGQELLASFRSEQAGYYRALVVKRSDLKVFINGWIRRAYS